MVSTARSILIVEDNSSARASLASILTNQGYEVASVDNGLRALEYLKDNPGPAVILLDMLLPVLDGWQFLEKLNEMELDPKPWVVLTTSHPAIGRDWALAHGCKGFVRKPLDAEKVLDELRRAFEG